MTLREVVEQGRRLYAIAGGECVEIHLSPEDEISYVSLTTPDDFVGYWADALERTCWPVGAFQQDAWLGLVHQEGACLINLTESK